MRLRSREKRRNRVKKDTKLLPKFAPRTIQSGVACGRKFRYNKVGNLRKRGGSAVRPVYIPVGHIVNAHGIKGELKLNPEGFTR